MEHQDNQTTALTQTAESHAISLKERCERLDLCNPANISQTFALVKTQTDAIALQRQGEPCMLSIKRNSGDDGKKMLAVIKLNIAALDRFLHLKNPLSEEEIVFVSEQIVEEFGGALTFADVHLVLKDAKAGKYGKFYERLSASDILEWFRTYYDKRLDAAYELNRRQDKSEYGSVQSEYKNLARLGYGINSDGTIGINSQRVEQINAEIERKRQEELDKEAERINKNTAEAQFMAQYREAERNGNVKEFLESLK